VGLFEAVLRPPVAVVVGNEEAGLSQETLAACSARVAIPMAPGQDSLNVGVAAGVILYELVRREAERPAGGAREPGTGAEQA
jgi:tRNA G18 (ribose-2'-O)-methylase SpoU